MIAKHELRATAGRARLALEAHQELQHATRAAASIEHVADDDERRAPAAPCELVVEQLLVFNMDTSESYAPCTSDTATIRVCDGADGETQTAAPCDGAHQERGAAASTVSAPSVRARSAAARGLRAPRLTRSAVLVRSAIKITSAAS